MNFPKDRFTQNKSMETNLHEKLSSRPLITPPPDIRRKVIASAYVSELPSPWILGVISFLLFAVTYSFLLKPGIILEWKVESQFDAFQLSRAISGTDRYQPLNTIKELDGKQRYSYWDPFTLPGVTYLYKIDAIYKNGIAFERVVTIHAGYDLLLSQLGIILFSLISSYSLTSIIIDRIKKKKFEEALIEHLK